MLVALIGYRGTGKTTVARRLALRLGCEWVDLDVEIELRAGKSIAAIFEEDGEAAFRDLESDALSRAVGCERVVLATGGGIVLRQQNRAALAEAARDGHVVWLRASPETIHRRLTGDAATAARRPNLTASGGFEEIVHLLAQRTPRYEECAGLAVDTDGKDPAEVAAEILERLPLDPQ